MADLLDFRVDPKNTKGWPRTTRQLEWANLHVLEGLSAHQAAIKAGYTVKTAQAKSFELPKKLLPFLTELQARKNKVAKAELGVTTQRVLEKLAAIAFADIRNYVREVELEGGVTALVGKPIDELTEFESFAVKSWKVVEVSSNRNCFLDYQYVLHDKLKALISLGKHLGMFNERLQIEMHYKKSQQKKLDYSNVPTELLEEFLAASERITKFASTE